MMYIDKSLTTIIDTSDNISPKDLKILKSLDKLINDDEFITENQSNLLIKILKENINKIHVDIEILENPIWSKPFRVVDKMRKLSIVGVAPDDLKLEIEYTYSSSLKKYIDQLLTKVPLINYTRSNTKRIIDLTEENIVLLVNGLSNYDFEIDPVIQEYYNTIMSWNQSDLKDQYKINSISHPNFQKQITNDLGINTPLTDNIIADRSIRYQYFIEKNNTFDTLTSVIANRLSTRVWIDSNKYSIENVIDSLVELRRFPILFVFNTTATNKIVDDLTAIHNALNKHVVNKNEVGIYFRLSNSIPTNTEFNQLIGEYGYNSQLDSLTKVVGIDLNKIPKFMLTSDWRPMSVISIRSPLRNNKSAIYASCSDLIITYTDNEPMIETRNLWE